MKTQDTSPSGLERARLDAALVDATSKAKQAKANADELARLLRLLAALTPQTH